MDTRKLPTNKDTITLQQSKTRIPRINEAEAFAEVYNHTILYPTIQDVADCLGIAPKTVSNIASVYRNANLSDPSFPHIISRKFQAEPAPIGKRGDMIDAMLMMEREGDRVSRKDFAELTEYEDEDWQEVFGTWAEFKRQAGLKLSRAQSKLNTDIAKHAAQEHYKGLNRQREGLDKVYLKVSGSRYQTVMVASDFHDEECCPFALRVFLDTAKRVQPDIIIINGDMFDMPEFGSYMVDPREWDVVGKIKYVHNNILAPLREACPDSQIDLISGNHEDRLMRHLGDATPQLRSILGDLHGFTIGKLLGLDRFEINYIAKSDLQARTKSDLNKELEKNYKVYFDQFCTNHFPQGRHLGLPGISGHHHKLQVWPMYSHHFGSYSWYQLGCMHRKTASYCQGEFWDQGFAIVLLDTEKKRSTIDYVDISESHAVAAGKIYYRTEEESVPK